VEVVVEAVVDVKDVVVEASMEAIAVVVALLRLAHQQLVSRVRYQVFSHTGEVQHRAWTPFQIAPASLRLLA